MPAKGKKGRREPRTPTLLRCFQPLRSSHPPGPQRLRLVGWFTPASPNQSLDFIPPPCNPKNPDTTLHTHYIKLRYTILPRREKSWEGANTGNRCAARSSSTTTVRHTPTTSCLSHMLSPCTPGTGPSCDPHWRRHCSATPTIVYCSTVQTATLAARLRILSHDVRLYTVSSLPPFTESFLGRIILDYFGHRLLRPEPLLSVFYLACAQLGRGLNNSSKPRHKIGKVMKILHSTATTRLV